MPRRLFSASGLVLLAMLVFAATGCQTARLTEPLEHENRHLEDTIYCLQDKLDEMQALLDSCRRENASLRRQLAKSGEANTEELSPPSAELGEPASGLPSREPEAPRDLEVAPPYQGPPTISPPDPNRPEGFLPGQTTEPEPAAAESSFLTPIGSGPALSAPGKSSVPLFGHTARVAAETEDFAVTEITLNRELTGGHNRDNRPGDDGVMVVVEPRNRSKELIQVPSALSIVVLDPAVSGPQARVARWDFNEREVADHFKSTALGDGYHFALPWPAAGPRHAELMLFVRYTLADGQQLVVDKPIRVKLPVPSGPGGPALPVATGDVPADAEWRAGGRRIESEFTPRESEGQQGVLIRQDDAPLMFPPEAAEADPR